MEFVEEPQKPPLLFLIVFTIVLVAASELFTGVLMSGQTNQVNQYYWLMDRAAGVTGYELLAVSTILGVSMTSGIWDRRGLRKWAKQLHQFTTLLVLPFVGLHLLGLFQDSAVRFTMVDLFVPGASTYHPFLTALGVLSVYGVAVLLISTYLRDQITVKAWRTVHLLAFPLFIITTVHGLFEGTDSHTFVGVLLMYILPMAVFVGFSVSRFLDR